ncbi:hypothetical protein RHMOL_Rhmol07G0246300 [Rhododendron molle]|uniref:Uncharacterized protein n=1 Tax=Rhododendron molle TaxID=49168 RepID=A0ACC0N445_RHOML|nr:hypothetical protein RHMOL_Rhmol07G0246300 [Rhododendron molle]
MGYANRPSLHSLLTERRNCFSPIFDCAYSRQIWESILSKIQILRPACGWENELNCAISFCKGNSFRALVFKLSLATGVYFIWLKRNSRVFGGNPKNPDRIIACIAENMRLRICTWRNIPKTVENQRLCYLWCISASLPGNIVPLGF